MRVVASVGPNPMQQGAKEESQPAAVAPGRCCSDGAASSTSNARKVCVYKFSRSRRPTRELAHTLPVRRYDNFGVSAVRHTDQLFKRFPPPFPFPPSPTPPPLLSKWSLLYLCGPLTCFHPSEADKVDNVAFVPFLMHSRYKNDNWFLTPSHA